MSSMKELIDGVIKVSNIAAMVIPQAKLVGQGAHMLEGLIDIVDGLKVHATVDQQGEMQATRAKLATAVKAHAASTASKLG